jgi:hypothetical protein
VSLGSRRRPPAAAPCAATGDPLPLMRENRSPDRAHRPSNRPRCDRQLRSPAPGLAGLRSTDAATSSVAAPTTRKQRRVGSRTGPWMECRKSKRRQCCFRLPALLSQSDACVLLRAQERERRWRAVRAAQLVQRESDRGRLLRVTVEAEAEPGSGCRLCHRR